MRQRLVGLIVSVGLAAGALLLLAASVQAAPLRQAPAAPAAGVTFTTTTAFDTPDKTLGDGLCQDAALNCSLRAAVQEIDALGNPTNTINLPAPAYVLTDTSAGDLNLSRNLTINGHFFFSGIQITTTLIQGGPGWHARIARVLNGATVALNYLTLSGGNLPAGNGGGLYVVSGTLQLLNTSLISNTAGHGGGLYNLGKLSAIGGSIAANHALTDGAGFYNAAPLSTNPVPNLTAMLIQSNTTPGRGGGIFNVGPLQVSDSVLASNQAGTGGGLFNTAQGQAVLNQSAVISNIIGPSYGGGVNNQGALATLDIVRCACTTPPSSATFTPAPPVPAAACM